MNISNENLKKFVSNCYKKVGIPNRDAETIADLQVLTDSRGVKSHGTKHLLSYINKLLDGSINTKPNIKIESETLSICTIDANNGLGHVIGTYAMQLAIKKAKHTGIGVIAVQNSSHYGAAACYSMLASNENMIGFTTSQTGSPSVAPFGGIDRLLDNAPISFAIPAKKEPAIVLDMACGSSSWGRIKEMEEKGIKLNEGQALDINGLITTDPVNAFTLLPFGEAKGFGLTVVMSILTRLLGRHQDKSKNQNRRGQLFIALNIEVFSDLNIFLNSVDEFIRDIRNSNTQTEIEKITLPGERAFNQHQKSQQIGIEIDSTHLHTLYQVANKLSVEFPWE
ncbi:Ldh family oxidoreductase [Fictibacillus nanhaiensis]|uniref:Ldh family oxidoreductase n=1 Tax=Fictibacillus nanhaiensis TaxID=742169 RepID=A0ABS2ZPS4_9BACL|nr:Ldh family oxidoreductase [Fictibacillus nanhaiensis]